MVDSEVIQAAVQARVQAVVSVVVSGVKQTVVQARVWEASVVVHASSRQVHALVRCCGRNASKG